MAIAKRTTIQLTDQSNGRNNWSIHFGRSKDDELVIGLHWQDKPFATHEFTVPFSEFKKAIEELGQ